MKTNEIIINNLIKDVVRKINENKRKSYQCSKEKNDKNDANNNKTHNFCIINFIF